MTLAGPRCREFIFHSLQSRYALDSPIVACKHTASNATVFIFVKALDGQTQHQGGRISLHLYILTKHFQSPSLQETRVHG